MTRERLQSLTLKALQVLSEQLGLDTDPGMTRNSLIDTIFEALEEDKIERQQLNNLAMRVKEKKYDISQDEELDFSEPVDYLIPERYNETTISLLLRDPLWAFAYWEIKEKDISKFKNAVLYLRVFKKTDAASPPDYFDIPVTTRDRSWYINLPDSNCTYYVEIISEVFGEEKVLSVSNEIQSPRTDIADHQPGSRLSEQDVLLFSGLYEFGGSSSMTNIPQRIISIIDNQFLNAKG